jgi:hypothetical protein
VPPQLERRDEGLAPEVAMIRGIGRPAPAIDAGAVFYQRIDAF